MASRSCATEIDAISGLRYEVSEEVGVYYEALVVKALDVRKMSFASRRKDRPFAQIARTGVELRK